METPPDYATEKGSRYRESKLDAWMGRKTSAWLRYTVAIFAVLMAMALDEADLLNGGFRIYLVFYPFIVIATLFGGFGPGLLAIALSAFGAAYFLVEPIGRVAIAARADRISMAIFIVGSLFIVWVCDRLRWAIRRAAHAEAKTESAAEIARKARLLKESEERLSLAQRAGKVGVFDWDIIHDKAIWTPEQEELFGIPYGEFKGNYEDWIKRVHPEDVPRITLFFEQWKQSGPAEERWEYRILRPDGETRWISGRGVLSRDADGQAVRLVGTNQDITERKRAQDMLRESETRCWTIFDSVVDAMIIIDERGIIESVNPAVKKLFGYEPEEVKGKNVKMLAPSPYREHHDEFLGNYLRTGIKKIIGIGREVTALHKNGTVFPIRLAVSEMRLGDQRLFVGQIHPITATEKAEQWPPKS